MGLPLWLPPHARDGSEELWRDPPLTPRPFARRHFFGQPCDCCEDLPCTLFADDCNVADSSDVSAKWQEGSGDWQYASNRLKIVASSLANGACIADFTGTAEMRLTCQFKTSATGAAARILLGYTDANNYVFAEVKVGGSGYISIVRRSGGTNTTVNGTVAATDLTTDTWYDFTACMTTEGRYCATVGAHSIARFTTAPSAPSIGVGCSGTGAVEFDDIVIERVADGCAVCNDVPAVQCHQCYSGFAPQRALATLPSYANDRYTGCGAIAGAYLLEYLPGLQTVCSCSWGSDTYLGQAAVTGCPGTPDWWLRIRVGHLNLFNLRAPLVSAVQAVFPGTGNNEKLLVCFVNLESCSGDQSLYAKPLGFDDPGCDGDPSFDCLVDLPATSHSLSLVSGDGWYCDASGSPLTLDFIV